MVHFRNKKWVFPEGHTQYYILYGSIDLNQLLRGEVLPPPPPLLEGAFPDLEDPLAPPLLPSLKERDGELEPKDLLPESS